MLSTPWYVTCFVGFCNSILVIHCWPIDCVWVSFQKGNLLETNLYKQYLVQFNPDFIAIARYNDQIFPCNCYYVFRTLFVYCRSFSAALDNDMFNSVITYIYPNIRDTHPFRYCTICMGTVKFNMHNSYNYWNSLSSIYNCISCSICFNPTNYNINLVHPDPNSTL